MDGRKDWRERAKLVFYFPCFYQVCSRWHSGKEFACEYRRHKRCGFDPWVGKISRRRKWQSSPVLSPRKSHGQRSLVGYSPWITKSQTWLSDFTYFTVVAGSIISGPGGSNSGHFFANGIFLSCSEITQLPWGHLCPWLSWYLLHINSCSWSPITFLAELKMMPVQQSLCTEIWL